MAWYREGMSEAIATTPRVPATNAAWLAAHLTNNGHAVPPRHPVIESLQEWQVTASTIKNNKEHNSMWQILNHEAEGEEENIEHEYRDESVALHD